MRVAVNAMPKTRTLKATVIHTPRTRPGSSIVQPPKATAAKISSASAATAR
jgi:hypothetical protein